MGIGQDCYCFELRFLVWVPREEKRLVLFFCPFGNLLGPLMFLAEEQLGCAGSD